MYILEIKEYRAFFGINMSMNVATLQTLCIYI